MSEPTNGATINRARADASASAPILRIRKVQETRGGSGEIDQGRIRGELTNY